jgi:hypothetical protein
MIGFDALFPKVLRRAPNCPEPVVQEHLVEAARMLCSLVKAWRASVTGEVTTPESVLLGDLLEAEWQAEVVEITKIRLDDTLLDPVTLEWLDEEHPEWDRSTDTATAHCFATKLTPNEITIYPRQTGTLTGRVVLMPAMNADELPEDIYSRYGDLIATGAAGAVLGLPNTEYANPALGGVLRQEFEGALPSESRKAVRGRQRASLRTKARYF